MARSRWPRTDVAFGKPILLCLAEGGRLDDWIGRLSPLGAFHLLTAGDLPTAATLARSCRPDLLLLDRSWYDGGLPPDCRERHPDSPLAWLPVVLVRPEGSPPSLIAGSEARASDELEAALAPEAAAIRLRAVLRRERPMALAARIHWGDIELRHDERRVLVGGRPVRLSFHEFNLLALLLEAPGEVWTRKDLQRALWGPGVRSEIKALNRLVQVTRHQILPLLGRDPIEAVRGQGYQLV